jgi:hypothetical protein
MAYNDDYIPISGSTFSLIKSRSDEDQLIRIEDTSILENIEDKRINLPTSLSDLMYESTETVKLSIEAAINLGIPVGQTEDRIGRSVFLQEYRKFTVLSNGTNEVYYGVCIRWIVSIKNLSAMANISTLPMVVASGQFNFVSATAKFDTVGISSSQITALMPAPTDLNTETYVELTKAFNEIKKLIWSPDTKIKPTIIGVKGTLSTSNYSEIEKSVSIVHALNMISRKRSLGKALKNIKDEKIKNSIESVYLELVKSSDLNYQVDTKAKDVAKKILSKY